MIGIIVGLIFFLIVSILIISRYMSKKWETEKELHKRYEKYTVETKNVKYCIDKYRREIQRAKELLSIGLVALKNEKVEIDAKDVQNIITTPHLHVKQYNIYYLLGEVLNTVNNAESDLMQHIERANEKIGDYNMYIKAPVFPRIIAGTIGYNEKDYENEDLEKLDNLLDQRITETELLEKNLISLLPAKNEKEKNRKKK